MKYFFFLLIFLPFISFAILESDGEEAQETRAQGVDASTQTDLMMEDLKAQEDTICLIPEEHKETYAEVLEMLPSGSYREDHMSRFSAVLGRVPVEQWGDFIASAKLLVPFRISGPDSLDSLLKILEDEEADQRIPFSMNIRTLMQEDIADLVGYMHLSLIERFHGVPFGKERDEIFNLVIFLKGTHQYLQPMNATDYLMEELMKLPQKERQSVVILAKPLIDQLECKKEGKSRSSDEVIIKKLGVIDDENKRKEFATALQRVAQKVKESGCDYFQGDVIPFLSVLGIVQEKGVPLKERVDQAVAQLESDMKKHDLSGDEIKLRLRYLIDDPTIPFEASK